MKPNTKKLRRSRKSEKRKSGKLRNLKTKLSRKNKSWCSNENIKSKRL